MTKEEKITQQVKHLTETIKAFITACPDFPEERNLVGEIGKAIAHVETTLHWEFGCWELALPRA